MNGQQSRTAADPFARLAEWGLLLLQDADLPSVASLVAGETVRGSWWGHPKGREIFRAQQRLADHPDIAAFKLLSGKVTFVHRRLWPGVMAVGMARERWQLERLPKDAAALLERLDAKGEAAASGKAARELERRLLAVGREVHSETGAHRIELQTWPAFGEARNAPLPGMSARAARAEFEELVGRLNATFGASAKLPWTG